ncbi:hypothetical protein J5U18_13715 [Sphingobacteriaceae bacterium WQ 2009]|uniref:Uncharacterized protein n=1 Tax=Rhinopithecimicrobium faecis TaxID=2820698 RepID=A0A8T4HBV2_9SPHI|nr:hypothetical protein [Sphingobacteriaceae bacterium WQ 2009]
MRSHNGMRPQDIVILLKIISLAVKDEPWQFRDLSALLNISISEISESLRRSEQAGLINGKKVARNSLMEFIQYGLKYVFPQKPGSLATGMPTAHSHPFYKERIVSSNPYVWPSFDGSIRGESIEPLHKGVINASDQDDIFYLLLASVDIIRVGRVREIQIAIEEIKKYVL